ncbi:MAG: hypothetical protein IT440_16535, partial [Phycisphaeraceae bacterium]|nr:hypothetical protein [Phycisphaeraceae bacterium]
MLESLCHTLRWLADGHEQEACSILSRLRTIAEGPQTEDGHLRDRFAMLAVWLALEKRNAWAIGVTDLYLSQPGLYADALSSARAEAQSMITPDAFASDDSRATAAGAVEWVIRAVDAAAGELASLLRLPATEVAEEMQTRGKALYTIIDEVVARVYFSAGLGETQKNDEKVSHADRARFYASVRPLLDRVLDVSEGGNGVPLLAPTAHHFMEFL